MQPGDKLPVLQRSLDLSDLVTYAGATWDWYRAHYDPDTIKRLKLQAAIVDGQMLGALLAEQAIAWAGPRAFIRKMSFRFRSMVFAGDTVRCESEITAAEGSRVFLSQRVLVGERVAVEPASMELDMRR